MSDMLKFEQSLTALTKTASRRASSPPPDSGIPLPAEQVERFVNFFEMLMSPEYLRFVVFDGGSRRMYETDVSITRDMDVNEFLTHLDFYMLLW